MKTVAFAALTTVAVLVSAAGERRISVVDFRDRMQGAWLGQSVGVGYGRPTEFKFNGVLVPDEKMPVWEPKLVNETYRQDDLYVEMTFVDTLARRGLDVTSREAGIDFANSRYRLWCANSNARNNLRNGIAAPASSHPKYHPSPDDIDYQIEADYSGIVAPGLPQAAVDLGETFGRIMNYGDGLYAGQFVGALYANAYFERDTVRVVEKALKAIPSESKYAEMVRDMLAWHRAAPKDWQGAWRKAVDKYQSPACIGKVSVPRIDVKINGAVVLLGLLFGEGDVDRTMNIATKGGYDSDCNPSSACGVLGAMIGFRGFDAKFKSALSHTMKWEFTDYTWGGLVADCEKIARQVVVRYGGRFERDAAGMEWIVLPETEVRPSAFHDSRNPGPAPADAEYSAEERARILYAPCEQGDQSKPLKEQVAVPAEMSLAAPGEIRPAGWLRDVAVRQRDGLTSRMDEFDEQFKLAWTDRIQPRGRQLRWSEKPGSWSCEGGAYWFDGLTRLAFQLDDSALKALASNRLETVLSKMHPNAIGFAWWLDRRDPQQVQEARSWEMFHLWIPGIAERALETWYRATGDRRAAEALGIALDRHAVSYGKFTSLPSAVFAAYDVTGDSRQAEAMDDFVAALKKPDKLARVFRQYLKPPKEWMSETLAIKRKHQAVMDMIPRHGVNASETLLTVFRAYQWTGDKEFLKAVRGWYGFFDRYVRQPYGVSTMDEEWGYPGPGRGTETCVVAAESWTRIALMAGLGEGAWGDDVERAFFNAGQNCATKDWRLNVYIQTPNRTSANPVQDCSFTGNGDDRIGAYAVKHSPLCCTAAQNRIVPNYIQSMWMPLREGGVAATLYGPCSVSLKTKDGVFAADEETRYPYGEEIVIRVKAAPAEEMPLKLRVPGWCAAPSVAVNGEAVAEKPAKGFVTVRRAWRADDVVAVRLPMAVRVEKMTSYNDRSKGWLSLSRGPLLYAHVVPGTDVNTPVEPVYVPEAPAALKAEDVEVMSGDLPRLGFTDATGRRLELVPYGEAKLRVSMFPLAKER